MAVEFRKTLHLRAAHAAALEGAHDNMRLRAAAGAAGSACDTRGAGGRRPKLHR